MDDPHGQILAILECINFRATCFDWLKKLRLFVNERTLKLNIVFKASRAVVIR